MKKSCILNIIISALILYPCALFGATIYVPADQPTIQAGLDAAVDGDLVLVAPGTYVENIDFSEGSWEEQDPAKSIELQSEEGAYVTVIDGNQADRVVKFDNRETEEAVIDGFTIRNGLLPPYPYQEHGSGIYCYLSSPTIQNCTISENTGAWWGGGIYCYHCSPTIDNCVIKNNSGPEKGGGIACYNSSSPKITNCTISENSGGHGGGIVCSYTSSPTIENCIISNNTITHHLPRGGGIYCNNSSSPIITNCTITENNSSDVGGGIAIVGASATITHCTLSKNTASKGGGIFITYNSTASLTNCILWEDDAGGNGDEIYMGESSGLATLTVSFSDVQGGEEEVYVGLPYCLLVWDDESNINTNPLFLDTYEDNYHLSYASPCIDAGTDAGVYIDIDGQARPQGVDEKYDMGSDEYYPRLSVQRKRPDEIQQLHIHYIPDSVDGEIGPKVASYGWIGKEETDTEVMFMATGDTDSDGVDELILVRKRDNGNQYLTIYEVPTTFEETIGDPIASDIWIGNIGSNTEISFMAPGDTDSDGVDELVFVRKKTNNNQYLTIYNAPTVVGGEINPVIAADEWIGNIGTNNEITHLATGDTDGDGTDELVFIRHRINGQQYLNIYDAPTEEEGEINPIIASDLWIGQTGEDNEITHMATGDTDGDAPEELLFIRHRANDNQYLNIYNAPIEVGGEINPLIASDLWVGNVGDTSEVANIDIIR